MFLVSVPRILKIAMRVPCSESTSKVACKFSAFYNFVKNSINWHVSKSSSEDFEKFPSNRSCKLIAYRNTSKNDLLTKILKEFQKFPGRAL